MGILASAECGSRRLYPAIACWPRALARCGGAAGAQQHEPQTTARVHAWLRFHGELQNAGGLASPASSYAKFSQGSPRFAYSRSRDAKPKVSASSGTSTHLRGRFQLQRFCATASKSRRSANSAHGTTTRPCSAPADHVAVHGWFHVRPRPEQPDVARRRGSPPGRCVLPAGPQSGCSASSRTQRCCNELADQRLHR